MMNTLLGMFEKLKYAEPFTFVSMSLINLTSTGLSLIMAADRVS